MWYASSQEQGAWAELFRHFLDDGIDPFEVRRRVGRVSVDLQVLDLTDRTTRSHLGVSEADLVSDKCTLTQDIAAAARDAGFDAVLAPAAALPVVKRSRCSLMRYQPPLRRSGQRFASLHHDWLTCCR